MKTVIGVAEIHDRGSEVSGRSVRGGAGYTMTQQLVVFDIDGQAVQLKTADLFPIKDGDMVGAAGNIKNGISVCILIKLSEYKLVSLLA